MRGSESEGATPARRRRIGAGREARDFPTALRACVPLAGAVDRFFTDVLVNADDDGIRARRYALIEQAAAALSVVADFEKVTS